MNPLLYGHNPKSRVVAVQQLNDRQIRLYQRIEGKIQHEDADFFPFFFIADPALLEGFPQHYWLKELSGGLFYHHVAAFHRWSEMWDAVNYAIKSYNKFSLKKVSHYHDLELILLKPDPIQQFLLQSGITLFKGMEFEELHRMQIDLWRSPRQASSRARHPENRVERIVLADTSGWHQILEMEHSRELETLQQLVSIIRERDPDILEGHDLFSDILPFLVARFEAHSIDCPIGRDGTGIRHSSPRQLTSGPESDLGYFEISGRHLLDTLRLAEVFDNTSRSLESYDLEYVTSYFGIEAFAESMVEGDSTKKKDAYLKNVRRVNVLSDHLARSNYYLAQMCPFNLGTLSRTGSAAKIESLLLREYLRLRHSLPRPSHGGQSRGGYTDIFFTGVYSNVLHADIESLYPSIMISQTVKPSSDALNIYVPLLEELTKLRLGAKRAMEQAETEPLRIRHRELQSAYKILINSFYGYLAYARALFNDYEQADRVTGLGQDYLKLIVEQATLFNAQVLEVDTDGMFFVPPDNVASPEQESSLVKRIASSLPAGINLVLAGRYRKMLSYRKKNYALLDYSNKVTIRGSSLISRSLEPFARRFLEKCIEYLLLDDIGNLHKTYVAFHRRITDHSWNVSDFARVEAIKDEIEIYKTGVQKGERAASAPYEAAIRGGRYVRPGVTISYYVTGSEAGVKIADHCRIMEEWDANLPDENTAYYLSRLQECSAKFRDFFTPADYVKVFSLDDLFGFTPDGIRTITRDLRYVKPAAGGEEPDDQFPIWIDDFPRQA